MQTCASARGTQEREKQSRELASASGDVAVMFGLIETHASWREHWADKREETERGLPSLNGAVVLSNNLDDGAVVISNNLVVLTNNLHPFARSQC